MTKLLSLLNPEQRHIRVKRLPYPAHWKSNQTITTNPTTLGEQIKNLRLQLHLCQAALAEMLGVKTATIYHWERGLCRPSKRFLSRIRCFTGQELRSSGAPIEHVEVRQEPEVALREQHIN
jgi:DNA-binding transcriptional regulator YiaG